MIKHMIFQNKQKHLQILWVGQVQETNNLVEVVLINLGLENVSWWVCHPLGETEQAQHQVAYVQAKKSCPEDRLDGLVTIF